jgi:hypothetical protein
MPASQPQGDSAPTTGPSTSATIQDSAAASTAPQTTNKGSGKASSGMFTNIQSYVQKNRPQAQKIAQATTKDFSKQASEIRKVAEEKKQEQSQGIQGAQQAMQEQKQKAQNIVGQVMQGQDVGEDQQQQFQELMQGPEVADISDINLTQQQMKTQALSNLAKSAEREEGRRGLMKEAFGDRTYTRGQSGLDELILGGDKAARESLIGGVQQQATGLQQDIRDIQSQSQQDVGQLRRDVGSFGEDVAQLAMDPQQQLENQAQQRYEEELAARTALLDPESEEYQSAVQAAQDRLDTMKQMATNWGQTLADLEADAKTTAINKYGIRGRDTGALGLSDFAKQYQEFEDTGKVTVNRMVEDPGSMMVTMQPVTLEGEEARKFLAEGGDLRSSHHKHRRMALSALEELNKRFRDPQSELYGLEGIDTSGKSGDSRTMLAGARENLLKQIAGLGSAEDVVQRRLQQVGGSDFEKLASGSDISKYETTSQEDVDKINTLRKMLGQEQLLAQDVGDRQYTDIDALRNVLKAYRG